MSDKKPASSPSSTKASSSPNFIGILFAFMALGGFIYAALGFIGLQEAEIPEGWQTTQGQIATHSIKVIAHKKSDGTSLETYLPDISYSYTHQGKDYIGNRLKRHSNERTIRAVAETEIKDIPQGTQVPVYFNPAKPEESVLRPSDRIGPMQAISAGLCIGIGCFAIFVISRRRNRKNEAVAEGDEKSASA